LIAALNTLFNFFDPWFRQLGRDALSSRSFVHTKTCLSNLANAVAPSAALHFDAA